jgi:chemotaxis methyl-accepting protein methylase
MKMPGCRIVALNEDQELRALLGKIYRDRGFDFGQEIKQLMDFRQHSPVSDEPFTCLDLVACRNVVIYFGRDLQEKGFTSSYRGLRQSGFLPLLEGPLLGR